MIGDIGDISDRGGSTPDLADVREQEHAKRALEVALAGGHSLLLAGPAGCGKTMLLRCLPTLLPWPIRSPHPRSTPAGMIGQGRHPGEAGLADGGVLVLEELPAFRRDTLLALRQPLAEGVVRVARRGGERRTPSSFLLIATMRWCPCGERSGPGEKCRCTKGDIARYRRRAGEVLGASFDIRSRLHRLPAAGREWKNERSAEVKARIAAARQVQSERFGEDRLHPVNGRMTDDDLRRHCPLDAAGQALVEAARNELGLSRAAVASALGVARTIADLSGRKDIHAANLAEAVAYRSPLQEGS